MEYTFRNSAKEKDTTLRLDAHAMEIRVEKSVRIVEYDEIIEVRLNHKGTHYYMEVTTLDEGTIVISNHAFVDGKQIDQSRLYMTFVRVLHVHLTEKSRATFQTGLEASRLMIRVFFIAGISALLFVAARYFDFLNDKPIFLIAFLAFPAIFIAYTLRLSQWQRSYSSINVPLHLLPPAS